MSYHYDYECYGHDDQECREDHCDILRKLMSSNTERQRDDSIGCTRGTPHWDNVTYGGSTRVKYTDQIEYNVRSSTDPETGLLETWPDTRIVFNELIPVYTPIQNIKSLVLTLENLQKAPSAVHVRLEVARRINQGFTNYVTLLCPLELDELQKTKIDVRNRTWVPTRDIMDSTNTSMVYSAFNPQPLSLLNDALGVEYFFDYPIATPYTRSYIRDWTSAEPPMYPELFSFNVGLVNSDTPSIPEHSNFGLSQIDVKLSGVELSKNLVTL